MVADAQLISWVLLLLAELSAAAFFSAFCSQNDTIVYNAVGIHPSVLARHRPGA